MNLNIGATLDERYKIISLIKIGGMSSIYKAEDKRLGKICAVKELKCPTEDPEDIKYAIKRFKEEAKLLADLSHPNLPRVSDYFTIDNYYIVMDLIEGVDLESLLIKNNKKGFPQNDVIKWSIQICNVLEYLHNQKPNPIVYRDLKPANIMLKNETDQIILIDFGIARKIAPNDMVTAIGTMEYAPIEQYQGKAEPRSDIYSLGATMHHLLTGKSPVAFKFPPIRTLCPDLSTELEELVIKALAPKVNQRFSSAKEMEEALVKILNLISPGIPGEKTGSSDTDSPEKLNPSEEKTEKKGFSGVFNKW